MQGTKDRNIKHFKDWQKYTTNQLKTYVIQHKIVKKGIINTSKTRL